MNFNKKNVLILAPSFYGYGEAISKEIRLQGANIADYFNCDPSPILTNVIKGCRENHSFNYYLKNCFNRKLKVILKKVNKKYNFILVICGWALLDDCLKQLREEYLEPDGRMILYYWDSRKNLRDNESRYQYFDNVKSFDTDDCKNYGFELLPLFYRREYCNQQRCGSAQIKYDLAIVASYNFFRYEIIDKIRKKNLCCKIFLHIYANKKIILIHKFLRKKCRKIDIGLLKSTPLKPDDITRIYDSSCAILDLPHPDQSGLSIRTLECLALEKKMITTNYNVRNYDFYNPNNIFVVSDNGVLPEEDWFTSNYSQVDINIVAQYSITNWVRKVFE